MKRHRSTAPCASPLPAMPSPSRLESLPEEVLFLILDRLEANPVDLKSLSQASRTLLSTESRHRRAVAPARAQLLLAALRRYPSARRLDLTLCPRLADAHLTRAAEALRGALRSVDLSRSRGFGKPGVEALAYYCAGLVEIDLSNGGPQLGDAAVAAVGRAPNLERLRLAMCKGVTDVGIGCVAVGCPKLEVLCLMGCAGITDLGVGLVAVKCRRMRSLDLSYLPITHNCLPGVLQLPHLEELVLEGCVHIEDAGLVSMQQECKSLKMLNVSKCQQISLSGLSSLTCGAPNLEQLVLSYSFSVTPAMAYSLQKVPNLHTLKLDGCQVVSPGLKSVGDSLTSLRELSLSKCQGVTDEDLSCLVRKHKDLRKLDITCCRLITDASIRIIAESCPRLASLRMESCSRVTKAAFVVIGRSCRALEKLDITDNDLDDDGLMAISQCRKLSVLKLGICMNVTDKSLVWVGKMCNKLQMLDLYRCVGITDTGLAAVSSGCPGLRSINLAYCTEVTDDSLRSLSRFCPALTTLEIRGLPRLTSAGICAVASGCRQLTKVDIKSCQGIDDGGVMMLSRFCQSLRQINMSYCSVTDAGLMALSGISCLQCVTMLHSKGLTPQGLATTLKACGSLRKVKLHASLKPVLPRHLMDYLEARGCHFLWKDKPLEVSLKCSKVWKQELEGVYNHVD